MVGLRFQFDHTSAIGLDPLQKGTALWKALDHEETDPFEDAAYSRGRVIRLSNNHSRVRHRDVVLLIGVCEVRARGGVASQSRVEVNA
jgi:hypothetical protein